MWLLLREGVSPETLLAHLQKEAIGATAHRLGTRWAVEITANGHLPDTFLRYEEVEKVLSTTTAYPLVQSWKGEIKIGEWHRGTGPLWIAGPCSVESRSTLLETAEALRSIGVHVLRGGAYKARTSPYSFQGRGEVALDWLLEAKALTGLPLCVEILSEKHLPQYEGIDLLQIGARNMDNYALLKEIGMTHKPVLLKRNPQATIEEWLLAAEYLLLYGAPWVLFCERGIRTFERRLRYTLDVGAIPVVQDETHLPVIVDPSHAAGDWRYVAPLAYAGIAAGAEGLIVEVHPTPQKAQSDPLQQLTVEQFAELYAYVNALHAVRSGRLPEPLQSRS